MSSFDPAKLARLQAQAGSVRTGTKGTPRRKIVVKASAPVEDTKLTSALKKLNVVALPSIEEALAFDNEGNVLHFHAPKVHAIQAQNTFAIYGVPEEKDLNACTQEQLQMLAPERLNELRIMSMQQSQMMAAEAAAVAAAAAAAAATGGAGREADDEAPELVAAVGELALGESGLEEVN